jgi:hypothetical protein
MLWLPKRIPGARLRMEDEQRAELDQTLVELQQLVESPDQTPYAWIVEYERRRGNAN